MIKITEEGRKRIVLGAIHSNEVSRQKHIDKYNASIKYCQECGNALEYTKRHNKFCNNSCAAKHSNTGRNKHTSKLCICGREHTNPKYCSVKCQITDKHNQRRIKIEKYGRIISRADKWYLEETRGYKCEVCGLSEWLGKSILLILDHIDGNSDNWSLTNLRLICSNCDAQTPTYKSKNRGNGRFLRRKRFQDGKSY